MKRSLTVFLCSTYSDLLEERSNVIDAISRLKLQHESMEFFGARPNQPIETYGYLEKPYNLWYNKLSTNREEKL